MKTFLLLLLHLVSTVSVILDDNRNQFVFPHEVEYQHTLWPLPTFQDSNNLLLIANSNHFNVFFGNIGSDNENIVNVDEVAYFDLSFNSHRNCKKILDINLNYALFRIKLHDFIPWKFYSKDQFHIFNEEYLSNHHEIISTIRLYQLNPIPRNDIDECPDMVAKYPRSHLSNKKEFVDESYNITIINNSIHIIGNSTLGLVRGLQTLPQLFVTKDNPSFNNKDYINDLINTNQNNDSNLLFMSNQYLKYCNKNTQYEKSKWIKEMWNYIFIDNNDLNEINQRNLIYSIKPCSELKYIPNTPLTIYDNPAFSHRGANIDLARNPISLNSLKNIIHILASVKYNKIHLHLTDSQSWPIEVPNYPNISKMGSYNDKSYYTQDDMTSLIKFSYQNAIELIPEIDIPGHINSLKDSFPNYIVGDNIQPDWWDYSAEPPSGQLKINTFGVDDLISNIISNVSLLFRNNNINNNINKKFHIGGDEFNRKIYELDNDIKSSDFKIIQSHLSKFLDKIITNSLNIGITNLIHWEEMVLEWKLHEINSEYRLDSSIIDPKTSIIQFWRNNNSKLLKDIISKGFNVILGSSSHWYFDCGIGLWLNPNYHNHISDDNPLQDWCSPSKSWKRIYEYDLLLLYRNYTLNSTTLNDVNKILGAEIHLWNEQIDSFNIEQILFPRAFAASEILWSVNNLNIKNNKLIYPIHKNYNDISIRLSKFRERIINSGINSGPIQMVWCLQNPNNCNQKS